jgi:hypothetical protein
MTPNTEWSTIRAVSVQIRDADRRRVDAERKVNATPETIRMLVASSAEKLFNRGGLGAEQLRAANEISRVFEKITAGLWARGADMSRVPGRSLSEDWPASVRRAYVERYSPWRDQASRHLCRHSTTVADLVLLLCVEGLGARQIADRVGMDQRTVLRLVRDSLYRYAEIGGWIDARHMVAAE